MRQTVSLKLLMGVLLFSVYHRGVYKEQHRNSDCIP